MRRSTLPFIAVFILVLVGGCSDKATTPGAIHVGQSVVLSAGQSIEIDDGATLTFLRVLGDGRCPNNPVIYCFWQGMASIELRLQVKDREPITVVAPILGFVTAADSGLHIAVKTGDYEIKLLQLDPYPTDFDQPVAEYQATIMLDEPSGSDNPFPPVEITDMLPSAIQIDPFVLDTVLVSGNELNMSVSVSGGCEEHYYALFMSPAVFMESYPVQANIYLRHVDNDDPCDAIVGDELQFDLTPIAALYAAFYGDLDPIVLNVHEYLGPGNGRVVSVTYTPVE